MLKKRLRKYNSLRFALFKNSDLQILFYLKLTENVPLTLKNKAALIGI
ncbi:hypothetical protein [Helicobacter heilmannii]|nr:hypothetical protein [Helicobacter heilmannii]